MNWKPFHDEFYALDQEFKIVDNPHAPGGHDSDATSLVWMIKTAIKDKFPTNGVPDFLVEKVLFMESLAERLEYEYWHILAMAGRELQRESSGTTETTGEDDIKKNDAVLESMGLSHPFIRQKRSTVSSPPWGGEESEFLREEQGSERA